MNGEVVNTDTLLMAVLVGVTLLGYMIAINAHGPTRLGLSYLIATVMLAGTVYVVVQHVNSGIESQKTQELQRLGMEKQQAEERIRTQEVALKTNQERMGFTARLNAIITKGTGLASTMTSIDLQDRSADLDVLVGRAAVVAKKGAELKDEFDKLQTSDSYFTESLAGIKEAIQLLNEASYYYKAYYYSEDSDQEQLRDKVMRQKSRAAYEKFQNTSSLLASGK